MPNDLHDRGHVHTEFVEDRAGGAAATVLDQLLYRGEPGHEVGERLGPLLSAKYRELRPSG
ncbi:hypothetical protein [Streptomyces brasiliscabiei]|uniref:hypothetical protein n=1 Tax=Streptomyces brasiliscabiei TaxID=2736302 RepID=UPI0038F67AFB